MAPRGRRFEARFLSLAEVLGPVLVAALLAFVVELVVDRPKSPAELAARLVGFPIAVLVAYLVGWWLGKRTWPKRGRALARNLVLRAVDDPRRPVLALTDRPDAQVSIARRVFEVVAFAAGSSVIVATALQIAGLSSTPLAIVASFSTLVAIWASFVLVPYWAFSRLGLRSVDPVRWLIEPMSRKYADRLRLANGALLLIAVGLAFNLAFRAGASGDEALRESVVTVLRIVASVLVVAATGVVHYSRGERALLRSFEEEALALGLKDARGMTDGEFLPRLP